MVAQHRQMDILAPLDLGDQASTSFRERAQGIPKEVLPPFVLPIVGAWWALASSHADKHSDLATGPLVHDRFIQRLRRGVVGAGTFVDEDVLSNLNGLEG